MCNRTWQDIEWKQIHLGNGIYMTPCEISDDGSINYRIESKTWRDKICRWFGHIDPKEWTTEDHYWWNCGFCGLIKRTPHPEGE